MAVFLVLFCFVFYIGVELINSAVSVSGVQPSGSVIHIHVSNLFQILFPFRSLQDIEQSSPGCREGPWWLSSLSIAVMQLLFLKLSKRC